MSLVAARRVYGLTYSMQLTRRRWSACCCISRSAKKNDLAIPVRKCLLLNFKLGSPVIRIPVATGLVRQTDSNSGKGMAKSCDASKRERLDPTLVVGTLSHVPRTGHHTMVWLVGEEESTVAPSTKLYVRLQRNEMEGFKV